MKSSPAVILDLYYTSLPVIRSLGSKGIRVHGIDKKPINIGHKCRYLKTSRLHTTDDDLIDHLVAFSEQSGQRPVLYPLSDEYLLFVSSNYALLQNYFCLPYTQLPTLANRVTKQYSCDEFDSLKIKTPKTIVLNSDQFKDKELRNFNFPVIIKPNLHDNWYTLDAQKILGKGRRVLILDTLDDLEKAYHNLIEFDKIIVQEYIPGPSETIFYLVAYRNKAKQTIISFVGRKLRTYPHTTGSETILEAIAHPQLEALAKGILDKLDYTGPAGLDFKYDIRSNEYYLIEINYRLGLSDGILVDCGLDIPYIYYLDSLGFKTDYQIPNIDSMVWYWFEKDVDWLLDYRNTNLFNLKSYLSHFIFNRHSYAAFHLADPLPFLFSSLNLLKRFSNSVLKRFPASRSS